MSEADIVKAILRYLKTVDQCFCWKEQMVLIGCFLNLKVKEGRTKQSKALHHLGDKARYKLLLTGTLITNRELDVWSQYRFVNPTIFSTSFYAFRGRFFDMVGYGNHIPAFRRSKTDEFLKRLHSVAYRVTKAEALDLPDITEETRFVELEPKAIQIGGTQHGRKGSHLSARIRHCYRL